MHKNKVKNLKCNSNIAEKCLYIKDFFATITLCRTRQFIRGWMGGGRFAQERKAGKGKNKTEAGRSVRFFWPNPQCRR